MNCVLLRSCRLVLFKFPYNRHIKELNVNFNKIEVFSCFNRNNMSQKSITSFFKITPKKSIDVKEDHRDERSVKRQRLNSSENELPKSEKKKKVKRPRIDSSSSESNSPKILNDIETSQIKLENSPKTYESPKSKKNKQKLMSTENNKKAVDKTPSPKKNIKKETLSTEKVKKLSPAEKSKTTPSIFDKFESTKKETPKANFTKASIEENDKINKEVKNGVSDQSEETQEKVLETEYNPDKSNYHPIKDACWSKGQEVPYLALAKTLEAIEGTSARLKMVKILSNYLRSVIVLTPEDLLPSVYMCLNQLAPAYHSVELGIAETYLMKVIGQCTGRSLAQVRSAVHKCGDLGRAAELARATQRTMFAPAPLSARRLFAALREIAAMTGRASVNKKISKIETLYTACRHCEAKYLIRSLEGKLRIGLAEQSVLHALALATATTPPCPTGVTVLDASKGVPPDEFKSRVDSHALLIKTTYCECPNYDLIIPVLLEEGVAALPKRCRLTPGIPLKPMLAHPTKGVHEVFNRFENKEFTCEWKYDGERAQIHVPAARGARDLHHAAVFSRNQENNTSKYPDILRRLPNLLKDSVTSCVLDCEAVAYDPVNNKILPFQILSTRKRKDAAESEIKVQVIVFVFDLLFLNGEPLVAQPLRSRRRALREHFHTHAGEWEFATSKDCTTMEEVQQFLEESVKGSCEGLMIKMLDGENAKYDIARRSHNWLKLKKDYLEGVGDTIDVVVIGGYLGKGKRAGVYGGFLLACVDPVDETYQSLCKIGTGFSDEDLQTFSEALKEHVIDGPRNYYSYDGSHSPDEWFSAALVWEVRCADLSLSPAHRAALGLVDPDKGISLRFPRFIRVREDKTPEQATSAQQIAQMYLSQDQVKNQAPKNNVPDDFY